jgi:hypothetical protein
VWNFPYKHPITGLWRWWSDKGYGSSLAATDAIRAGRTVTTAIFGAVQQQEPWSDPSAILRVNEGVGIVVGYANSVEPRKESSLSLSKSATATQLPSGAIARLLFNRDSRVVADVNEAWIAESGLVSLNDLYDRAWERNRNGWRKQAEEFAVEIIELIQK